ncbi:hypothetical protein SAMN06295967_11817 [Belliella buryatensis]|uniref:DKNYY family protein n=1 Tax=Belliella buryatensis TaxID=1500549 RepID=A0A239GPX7_9BACT|nr:hypothetical protein [Belliella buryatensis]SNS70935.1 hypothetical protein SAMN06295967_11817 [Belliella buryatensis]
MLNKSTVFLSCFLLFIQSTFAQIEIENKLDLDVKFSESDFITINTYEGVIGFRSYVNQSKGPILEVFATNKGLDITKSYQVPLQTYYSMVGYYLFDLKLYLIFEKRDLSETKRYLIEADFQEQRTKQYSIDNLTEMILRNFMVIDRKVVLQGELDQSPVLQLFDLENGEITTLPGIFFYKAKVLQLHHDKNIDYFNVLIRKEVINKVYESSLISFDTNGNLIREITLNNPNEKKMEYIESILFSSDNLDESLIGTYGQKKKSAYYGYYQNTIEDFGNQNIQFFNLYKFPKFYNYLPERKAKRLTKRLERKKENIKSPKLKPLIAVRKIVEHEDYQLVYSETFTSRDVLYYPRRGRYADYSALRMGSITPSLVAFNPIPRGLTRGDSYRLHAGSETFTNNFIENFRYVSGHLFLKDKEDNIIWDDAVSLKPSGSHFPIKIGEVNIMNENELHHIYNVENNLFIHFFNPINGTKEKYEVLVTGLNNNEELVGIKRNSSKIVHWYEDYYLFSSTQRIRYTDDDGNRSLKDIFSLYKVKIHRDQFNQIER